MSGYIPTSILDKGISVIQQSNHSLWFFLHSFFRSCEILSDVPDIQSSPVEVEVDDSDDDKSSSARTLVLNTHQLASLSTDDSICVERKLFTYEDESLAYCPTRIHGGSWLAADKESWFLDRNKLPWSRLLIAGRSNQSLTVVTMCLNDHFWPWTLLGQKTDLDCNAGGGHCWSWLHCLRQDNTLSLLSTFSGKGRSQLHIFML